MSVCVRVRVIACLQDGRVSVKKFLNLSFIKACLRIHLNVTMELNVRVRVWWRVNSDMSWKTSLLTQRLTRVKSRKGRDIAVK